MSILNHKKCYAGIGSRNISNDMAAYMYKIATKLAIFGYTLRSGKANGSDQMFEKGSDEAGGRKEIFITTSCIREWTTDEVLKSMPNDRGDFNSFNNYVQRLLKRNMMQILGEFGDEKVQFVACYAPSDNYEDSSAGGTGYAIRCAIRYNIPVYNFWIDGVKELFEEEIMKPLEKTYKIIWDAKVKHKEEIDKNSLNSGVLTGRGVALSRFLCTKCGGLFSGLLYVGDKKCKLCNADNSVLYEMYKIKKSIGYLNPVEGDLL